MLYTVSDDGSFIANCELYILDKRNAVMQFVIDTGASITCCRAKELGIKGFIPVSWDRMYYKNCIICI